VGPRVYLDTNCLVFMKEAFGERADLLVDLVEVASHTSPGRLVSSELTLAETLVRPIARRDAGLIQFYEQTLRPGGWLAVEPVSWAVLRDAAEVRALHGSTKLPDAIHIATALSSGCVYFLSDDLGLKGEYRLSLGQQSTTVLRPEADTLRALITELATS